MNETNQQLYSFCDEVDILAQDFFLPAKDHSPVDLRLLRPIASWSRLQLLLAFYVKTDIYGRDTQAQDAFIKKTLKSFSSFNSEMDFQS